MGNDMTAMPHHAAILLKAGLCLLPAWAGLWAAGGLALRRDMFRLAGVWKRLARLVLTASAVLMLAGLLAWIMA